MRRPGSRHDDTLKIRLLSELKNRLRGAAESDGDTQTMTDWVLRELRAGLKIRDLEKQ